MHKRLTQTSVNITAFCQGKVLLMKRWSKVSVDQNKVNNVWGKVELWETVLECARREFLEETPYKIEKSDLTFKWYAHIYEWYSKDRVMTFFEVHLPDETDLHLVDGFVIDWDEEWILFWEDPKKTLEHDCVDDLHYLWEAVCTPWKQFFFNWRIDENLKVAEYNLDIQ